MDSAFKKLIYWSGHTHSLLGLAVHQLYEKRGTSSLLDNITRMLLIPQMTLKVDFLQHRSRITIHVT